MYKLIKLRIDGQPTWADVHADGKTLSGLLRSIGKAGPKADCGDASCGACTVMIGERPVRSCTVSTETCAGGDVWTADHFDYGASLHPMLISFRNRGVLACGTCMPGMLIAAIAYAARNRELSDEEIERDLVADICRCERSGELVAAVREGAAVMHRLRPMD